jgi:hypothetical protein
MMTSAATAAAATDQAEIGDAKVVAMASEDDANESGKNTEMDDE